ncbi:MAG: hypothetical protein OEV40_21720 [Acidimicrobiia bacterium]|nr:hypothetical protein [Acidimicrobiia bacterium]
MKIAVPLLALAVVVGACASDTADETTDAGQGSSDSSSESSPSSETTAPSAGEAASPADGSNDEAGGEEAMGNDPADGSGDDPAGGETGEDPPTAGDEAMDDDPAGGAQVPGLLITAVLAQAGVEPTDEIVACVESRGIDLDLAPTASEEEVAEATLAIFGCAPDELGQVLASDTVAPPGTDTEDVACVIGETFRYLGTLPTEEALAALEADTPPQEIRDDLRPIAEEVCGLDRDQVDAILDS